MTFPSSPAQWAPGAGAHNGARQAGRDRDAAAAPPRVTGGPRRRRRLPYLLLGVVLVTGCAAAGALLGAGAGQREPVLVLARAVSAGQVLTPADVRDVHLAVGGGLEAVPASSTEEIIGRPVAYTLPAGTLLTRTVVGAAQMPPPGQAVTAVALEPGQFPPGLTPGTRVTVVVAPGTLGVAGPAAHTDTTTNSGSAAPAASPTSWAAVAVAVQAGDAGQATVVSLQMSEADARALASVPAGQVSLVVVGGGGG